MQSDWSRVFSIKTQELDFYTDMRFLSILKGGVSFKTKKSH